MNERFLNPTPATRWKLLAACASGLVVLLAMEIWWNPFMSYVEALPVCEGLPYHRGIFIAFTLGFAFASFSSLRAGRLILRAGESPFPGAWVLFRTRIKTGIRAKIDGYAMLAIAVLLAAAPIAAGLALNVHMIFCVPNACGCE